MMESSVRSDPARSWRALARDLYWRGIPRIIARGINRAIPPRLLDAGVFLVLAADLDPEQPRVDTPDVRWATWRDVDRLATLGSSRSEVCRHLEMGASVAILERGQRFVACNWVHPRNGYVSPWLRITGREEDSFSFDLFTLPELRGSGLITPVRMFVSQECARRGFARLLSAVESTNHSSLRSAAKLDRKVIGRIFYLRLLGATLVVTRQTLRIGSWSERRYLRLPIETVGRRSSAAPESTPCGSGSPHRTLLPRTPESADEDPCRRRRRGSAPTPRLSPCADSQDS